MNSSSQPRDRDGKYAFVPGSGKDSIPAPSDVTAQETNNDTVTDSLLNVTYEKFRELNTLTNTNIAEDTTLTAPPVTARNGLYDANPTAEQDKELQRVLLSHGGEKAGILVLDEDTPKLLDEGFLMDTEALVVMQDGIPSQCHSNCAAIWDSGEWQGYVCTGYALTDGAWLVHSWMIDDQDVLYETTGLAREKYFGIVLDPYAADVFAWENY